MTKTYRESTEDTNDDLFEWLRKKMQNFVAVAYKRGELHDYRHAFLVVDLMEAKDDDDLASVCYEFQYGLHEMRASQLLYRMHKGLEVIKKETDAVKVEKLWKHYKKLEKEREEVMDKCQVTRYLWNPYHAADESF